MDDKDSFIPVQILRMLASGVNSLRGYVAHGTGGLDAKPSSEIGTLIRHCLGMVPQTPKSDGLNLQAWAAQSMINNLVAELTPYLLQPYASVANPKERGLVAGARSGEHGAIYISVLMSDSPKTTTLDLSQYLTGRETSIERITVIHGRAQRTVLQPSQLKSYQVKYLPGQGELFVFKRQPVQRGPSICLP